MKLKILKFLFHNTARNSKQKVKNKIIQLKYLFMSY